MCLSGRTIESYFFFLILLFQSPLLFKTCFHSTSLSTWCIFLWLGSLARISGERSSWVGSCALAGCYKSISDFCFHQDGESLLCPLEHLEVHCCCFVGEDRRCKHTGHQEEAGVTTEGWQGVVSPSTWLWRHVLRSSDRCQCL